MEAEPWSQCKLRHYSLSLSLHSVWPTWIPTLSLGWMIRSQTVICGFSYPSIKAGKRSQSAVVRAGQTLTALSAARAPARQRIGNPAVHSWDQVAYPFRIRR